MGIQDLTRRSIARVASVMMRSDSDLVARAGGIGDAVAQVLVDQPDGDALQRLRGGRHLREDVDAVVVVLDHPLEPADLPLDAAEPLQIVGLVVGVSRCVHDASFGQRIYHHGVSGQPLRQIPPMGIVVDMNAHIPRIRTTGA